MRSWSGDGAMLPVGLDGPLVDAVRFHQNASGAVAGPFDAWLTLRGLKTLAVRMDRHCANAAAIAAFLDGPRGRDVRDLPGPRRPTPGTRSPRGR